MLLDDIDDLVLVAHTRVADYLNRVRSEEHTSELQSLSAISYAVFCLKEKLLTLIHIHATGVGKDLTHSTNPLSMHA